MLLQRVNFLETLIVAMSKTLKRMEEKMDAHDQVRNDTLDGIVLNSAAIIEIFDITPMTLYCWRNEAPPFNMPAFKRGRKYFYNYDEVMFVLTKGYLGHTKAETIRIKRELQRYKDGITSTLGIDPFKKVEQDVEEKL